MQLGERKDHYTLAVKPEYLEIRTYALTAKTKYRVWISGIKP
jgi:hypothetical protein